MASEGARPKLQVNVPAKPQQTPERTVSLVWGRQKRDEKKILSLAGEPEVFGADETEFPPLPDKESDTVTTDEEGEIGEETPTRKQTKPAKNPHDPEREVYEPDLEINDQVYFPQLHPDRSSYREFTENSRLPDNYICTAHFSFTPSYKPQEPTDLQLTNLYTVAATSSQKETGEQ